MNLTYLMSLLFCINVIQAPMPIERETLILGTWSCTMDWECSDGYNWQEQSVEETFYDGHAMQETVLWHWAFYENPTQFEINDTGTYRFCKAITTNCTNTNNRTVYYDEYFNDTFW